jgi:phosphohistidine phosphatase
MLTLSLLRHAKSSWADASLEDFMRPLAERGLAAAPRMGHFMAQRGIAPGLILCSPAVRARQTLELVLPHLPDATVAYEDNLYLATGPALLARMRELGSKPEHVMVVGHDPGMHDLAVEIIGEGEPQKLRALAAKFPTAALAVIHFKARSWSKLAAGTGHLELFQTPKTLP